LCFLTFGRARIDGTIVRSKSSEAGLVYVISRDPKLLPGSATENRRGGQAGFAPAARDTLMHVPKFFYSSTDHSPAALPVSGLPTDKAAPNELQ
jgi:hypothetical protein